MLLSLPLSLASLSRTARLTTHMAVQIGIRTQYTKASHSQSALAFGPFLPLRRFAATINAKEFGGAPSHVLLDALLA